MSGGPQLRITVADDAGALLVRSGLVSPNALDEARARVAAIGGTVGEALVTGGAIADDALTDFYRSRLLVPQVNPNLLARLTPSVVAAIPGDMAIELRAIPVALDGDNNLTVAMSDPSDRHAVDEIAFFTGAYVVRAVATQMQIAWCLAHYYGHVTALGHRLLQVAQSEPRKPPPAASRPRTKGLTGKVNATRHRAVAPVTGPVDVLRPSSGPLDLRPLDAAGAAAPGVAAAPPAGGGPGLPSEAQLTVPGFVRPNPLVAAHTPPPGGAVASSRSGASMGVSGAAIPKIVNTAAARDDAAVAAAVRPTRLGAGAPGPAPRPSASPPPESSGPRASDPGSGAARPAPARPPAPTPSPASAVPGPSAHRASPTPPPGPAGAPAPTAVAKAGPEAPAPGPSAVPPVADPAAGAPPARLASGPDRAVSTDGAPDKPRARSVSGEIRVPVRRAPSIRPPLDADGDSAGDDEEEPMMIMIEMREEDEDLTPHRPPPVRRRPIVKSDPPELKARAGEVDLKAGDDRAIDADEPRIVIDEDALAPPTGRIDVRRPAPGAAAPPVTAIDVVDDTGSGAVIHDRVVDRDGTPPDGLDGFRDDADDADTGEIDIVMLDAPKRSRPERRTQLGLPPAVNARSRDSAPLAVPDTGADAGDATSVDLHPAPPGEDTTSDQLAAPPAPVSDADTNPYVIAPPPSPGAPARRGGSIAPAVIVEDDDDETPGPHTTEMTAVELDDAVPERASELSSEQLLRRGVGHDAVDDGWGPPGTTIPPPLLGAIPGSDDDDDSSAAIPMPNVDSSPLIVTPPGLMMAGDPGGRALARALEDATARAIEVIRRLEHTRTRDEIVEVMVSYLAETHHRAGFFVTRHTVSGDAGELAVFGMMPRPVAMPSATLRLDRPSTLEDVVGTRLPYRGPMHDDASRAFLISVLGACPAEILLVPVTVRERVVGVLFGEHRQRHTFDDQLALAARAAGMALERILRARRG